jgi:cell shape-determining protein MreC
MLDFILGILFFIFVMAVVFGLIVYLFAYWATSSTFVGCQETRDDLNNLLKMLDNLSQDIKKLFRR